MYESVNINTCLYLSFCECCCRLTSRAGTICSMWRGSQMFTCNSSSTVFLTTPCSPRIPDTRILNTHKLHKFTHKHTKYTFISRLWSWVLFCCLFYETVHNFGLFHNIPLIQRETCMNHQYYSTICWYKKIFDIWKGITWGCLHI